MAYVVTGATGHIGNNLVKRLIGLNQKVRILTRRVDESIDNLQAEYKIGDVFNREFLLENINSEDVVIHLAGVIDVKNNKKEQTMKINYEGTKLITDICIEKKVKRYIYFSSVDCIYKENDEEVFEPTKIYPDKFIDNYSHSKALATEYVMGARTNTDVSIDIVYPSAVIGTNDFKPSSIGNVVSDIIDGKMQFGIKGGYNFVDVDDVVNATISIINNELEGDYLLTGTNVTVYELYDKVNEQLNRKKKTMHIPLLIVKLFIPFTPYLSKFVLKTIMENHNYNNQKMIEILKIQPTSFEDTLKKTIKFFEERKK